MYIYQCITLIHKTLIKFHTHAALLHVPTRYTRPAGLQSVNGSDTFGGCPQTPQNCTLSEGGVDVCQCPGATPATGVLIDRVIPTIDPISDMNHWSSQLFTVNRNGQSSIIIGFSFSSPFVLRGVEMKLFNCPAWNIVASTINVYGTLVFPTFIQPTAIGGSVDIAMIQDCRSLSTVVIPVQLTTSARDAYYIEMTFNKNPSAEWTPSIAEIHFSDETPTEPPTTELPTTEPLPTEPPTTETNTTSSATPPVTETTELLSTTGNIVTSRTNTISTINMTSTSFNISTISMTSTSFNVTTTPTNIISINSTTSTSAYVTSSSDNIVSTSGMTSTSINIIGTSSMALTPSNITTSFTNIINPSSMTATSSNVTTSSANTISMTSTLSYVTTEDVTTTSGTTSPDSVSSTSSTSPSMTNTTIIGVLVAIIGLLIVLLIIGAFAVLGCLLFQRRSKKRNIEIYQLQDATMEHPEEHIRYSTIKETDTAVNQHYEDIGTTGYAAISSSLKDDKLYSIVKDERKGSRDGLDTVGKGLYQDIDSEQKMTHKTTPPKLETHEFTGVPYYAQVEKPLGPPLPPKTPELYRELQVEKENGWRTATDPPFVVVSEYTDVGGASAATEKEIYSEIGSSNQLSTSPSGPVLLSKSLCNEMDENPDYESSGSAILFAGMANRTREIGGEIYANPDVRFSQEEIYDTIYSEPIQPLLFDPKASDYEEESEDIQPYAPIYALAVMPALSDDMRPLHVTHDNILETDDLGTGFFGNVVLAQTSGLSRKDLKLSETDDDKTVTLQVAVKMLKRNASKKQKQAFEKEHMFMSRLNHPNVIRMLAVCSEDVPFIMMEYMENGDLNQYLQKFTSISNESIHSESEIKMNTLVCMSTQIASAMIYLSSKNYVHRDLAIRNCLVGQNFLVKLGDFGMSRNLYESHYYIIRGRAILPVRWMATECFYGKFGDREVAQDAIKKEKRTLLEKPPYCPQEIHDVMLKCWASDPKERATFEELHEALSSLDFSNKDDDCSV